MTYGSTRKWMILLFASMSSFPRRPKRIQITTLMLVPLVALADYGSGAVEISCDPKKDTLTINTYIKWNEDYDSFIAEHPSGSAVSTEKAVFTLSEINDKVDHECRLRTNSFIVRIRRSMLLVFTGDGKNIYKYHEGSGESIYGLSSSIESYELRVGSSGKVIECITRGEKQTCRPYINK